MDVDATGIWEESRCAIPGEICPSALVLLPSRDGRMDGQKSAEGIVAPVQKERRPEHGRAEGDRYLDGRDRRRQEG